MPSRSGKQAGGCSERYRWPATFRNRNAGGDLHLCRVVPQDRSEEACGVKRQVGIAPIFTRLEWPVQQRTSKMRRCNFLPFFGLT